MMNLFFENRFFFRYVGEPFLKRRGIHLNLMPLHHPSQIELLKYEPNSRFLEMREEEFVMRAQALLPKGFVSNYLIQGYFEQNPHLIRKPWSQEYPMVSDVLLENPYIKIVFLSRLSPFLWEHLEREKRGRCESYVNRVPLGGFKLGSWQRQIRIYPRLCRSVLVVDLRDFDNPKIIRSQEWFSGVSESVTPYTVVGYIDTGEIIETC